MLIGSEQLKTEGGSGFGDGEDRKVLPQSLIVPSYINRCVGQNASTVGKCPLGMGVRDRIEPSES